jgi:hypothetical protein
MTTFRVVAAVPQDTIMAGSQYHVFLAYNEQHRPAVEELARWLVREGLSPFFDQWGLIPGLPRQEALERALIASVSCAVVLGAGEDGIGPWQEVALRTAIDRQVRERAGDFRIIPVLLPGAVWSEDRLPAFLKQYERVAFDQILDDAEALHRLACGIRGESPGFRPGAAIVPGVEPYRGLRVFKEKHASLFFGRERLTRELVEQLREPAVGGLGERLLAVLGPSGSGKSSVVRAGLVPALRRGALEGSASWPVAVVNPGAQPLESLAVALETLGRKESPPISVYDRVAQQQDGARSLHVAARLLLGEPPRAARLLLVVDQFEEIFTLCTSADLRTGLIGNLLGAVAELGGPVVVVLAMRADFYGHCAGYRGLADLMERRQKLVGAMNSEELRWAIEKPAQRCGGTLDSGVVELLLQDALGQVAHGLESERAGEDSTGRCVRALAQPGHLPLLEFALSELWRRRVGGRLTTAAYREIGGLVGALERHANEVLAKMIRDDPANERICRRIFLSLIHPGQGTVDSRRSAAYPALATNPRAEQVVRTLVDARLLTADDTKRSSATVDLAHEALIQNWTELRRWITAERDDLLTRDRLADDAREWATKRDCHPDYLYQGARLALALEWDAAHPDEAGHTDHVAEFLASSREAEQRRKQNELDQERNLREVAEVAREAERKRAEEAVIAIRRQTRLSHWLLVSLVVTFVSAVASAGLGWWANTQRIKAVEEAHTAESRRLAALSDSIRPQRPDQALLLALEALQFDTLEARDSLGRCLDDRPEVSRFHDIPEGYVREVAVGPGGTIAASYLTRGVNPILSGVVIFHKSGRRTLLEAPEGQITSLAIGAGDIILAGYSGAGGVGVMRLDAQGKRLGAPFEVRKSAFTIRAFGPGGTIVTVGPHPEVSRVVLLDAQGNPVREAPIELPGYFTSVAFGPEDNIAVGYWRSGKGGNAEAGGVVLLDKKGNRIREPIEFEKRVVERVAISREGIIAAGYPSGVVLMDAKGKGVREFPIRIVGTTNCEGVAFGRGGVIVARFGQKIVMLDGNDKQIRHQIDIREGHGGGVAIGPQGTIAAYSRKNGSGGLLTLDATIKDWFETAFFRLEEGSVTSVAFDREGIIAVGYSGRDGGGVVLLDEKGKAIREPIKVPGGSVTSVAFGPRGIIAAGYSGRDGGGVVLLDEKGEAIREPIKVPKGSVTSVAFGPGGTVAAGYSGRDGGGVVLLDEKGKAIREPIALPEIVVSGITFGPGGTVAVGCRQFRGVIAGVLLFDAQGEPFRTTPLGRNVSVECLAFGPRGTIAVGYSSKFVKILDADPASWRRKAMQVANRNLTRKEWTQFFHGIPYRRTIRSLPWPDDLPEGERK